MSLYFATLVRRVMQKKHRVPPNISEAAVDKNEHVRFEARVADFVATFSGCEWLKSEQDINLMRIHLQSLDF